jgi:methylthioribulose-1-phosphate dehydratase
MTGGVAEEVERIVEAGRFLSARGWAPAGSGNYSHRLPDRTIAITVSGAHKARLVADDVMILDVDGRPLDERRPSAETPLHLMVYRLFPKANAVVHTHSVPAVVVSRLIGRQPWLRLAGYELLKAFPGVETHDFVAHIPVFDNSQDLIALAETVAHELTARDAPAFLIRDHGLYGWGVTMDEALRVMEAAETMIACELELMRLHQETSP